MAGRMGRNPAGRIARRTVPIPFSVARYAGRSRSSWRPSLDRMSRPADPIARPPGAIRPLPRRGRPDRTHPDLSEPVRTPCHSTDAIPERFRQGLAAGFVNPRGEERWTRRRARAPACRSASAPNRLRRFLVEPPETSPGPGSRTRRRSDPVGRCWGSRCRSARRVPVTAEKRQDVIAFAERAVGVGVQQLLELVQLLGSGLPGDGNALERRHSAPSREARRRLRSDMLRFLDAGLAPSFRVDANKSMMPWFTRSSTAIRSPSRV